MRLSLQAERTPSSHKVLVPRVTEALNGGVCLQTRHSGGGAGGSEVQGLSH